MYNGEAQEVFVIEVDHMPVYYSWVDKPDEYSFYIDPGRKHVISLRLSDRVIELDSMQFEKGTKTIFSILSDNLPFGSKVTKLENRFSKAEIYRMFPTLASFSGTRCKFSYLYDERQDEFIPLFGKTRNYGYKLVGPLTDGKKTYTESCGTNITYWHRGGFNYEFDENVVYKTNAENLLPQLLFTRTFNPMDKINDLEMTRSSLRKLTGLPAILLPCSR
ncbi:MAG TPA: hypothetical protein VHO68_15480 [Bacteroidales bacterium]|nr:hypothetical protein [Bacteroidales bacterium]